MSGSTFQFRIGDETMQIDHVVERWHSQEFLYIKVLTADERLCVVRYDPVNDHWVRALWPIRNGDTTMEAAQ